MAPKPKELTAPLKPAFLAGLVLLFPLCLTAFVAGILGMKILLDEDSSSGLSQSLFGQYYKRLIAINPFFSALLFNGGMIGSMFCVTKLVEHGRALKRAKMGSAAAAPAAAGTGSADQEAKKDK
ncbi:hypothetical protein Vafri_12957 [Volvox africanus]|nr:hypothetical protein Vafri_12957 [Volvox africanus]